MDENNIMTVEPLLATKGEPGATNGLVTVRVHVPVYIWTEILTHRRFARNASSSRAQSVSRHRGMGYYTPPTFYGDVPGMQVGNVLPDDVQKAVAAIWQEAWLVALAYTEQLREYGVSREQTNRLLPTIKMVNGIITGTEDAWDYFLELRDNRHADTAMQLFSKALGAVFSDLQWQVSKSHVPLAEPTDVSVLMAVARIARVTYSGKTKVSEDGALAARLLSDGHLSPFEHVAQYGPDELAGPSCLNLKGEDVYHDNSWATYRSMNELGMDWDYNV